MSKYSERFLLSRLKSCLSLILILACWSVFGQNFVVRDFSADFYLREDGYFDVVEVYDVEFLIQRRGIFRVIQTKYDFTDEQGNRSKHQIKISNIDVPGYNFDTGSSLSRKYGDRVTIKIGEEDVYISGDKRYEIRYRVDNAFLFKEDAVQFYWNIKTDGWPTDFENIRFRVFSPDGVQLNRDNTFVYSGRRGTTTVSNDFNLRFNDNLIEGESVSGYVSSPDQNLTVLINLPPDSIAEIEPASEFFGEYGWTLLITAILGSFYAIWSRYGKDDELPATTSYYPPKNIDPAMAGYLINDRSDQNDLVSLIPHWGSQGLIRIEEIESKGWFSSKDTRIIKLQDLPETVPEYESKIFTELFSGSYKDEESPENEVLVSKLKNKFYTTMSAASTKLKKSSRLYYDKQSIRVRSIVYIVLIVGGIGLTVLSLFIWSILAAVLTAITCLVLAFINFYMIRKNREGNMVQSELKGFKSFIKIAEKNKLKMLLQENDGYFENTMAYAMAFGMFDKWAGKFSDLNVPPPTWYHSSSGATHNSMSNFTKSFSSSISSVTTNMVSSPSSSGSGSGGGSSGGGFGGGGGGSW